MFEKKTKRIWSIVALLIASATLFGMASAADEEDEAKLYRLDFRVTEFRNGDTESKRAYSVLARAGTNVQIRTGNRVPIFPPDGVEYLSVGLHIDCRIDEGKEGRVRLAVSSEINSFVLPEQAEGGSGDPPVIRAISSSVDTTVTIGQTTMVSSIDDVMSDSRYQLDVTVKSAD